MASLQFYFPFSHFNVFSWDLWNDLIKQLLAVPQLVLFSVVRRWKMLFHVNHLEMIILVEDMFVLETIARFYVYFCLRMWICHLFPFHLLRQLFNWICERVFSLSSFVYFHFYIFFCFFFARINCYSVSWVHRCTYEFRKTHVFFDVFLPLYADTFFFFLYHFTCYDFFFFFSCSYVQRSVFCTSLQSQMHGSTDRRRIIVCTHSLVAYTLNELQPCQSLNQKIFYPRFDVRISMNF